MFKLYVIANCFILLRLMVLVLDHFQDCVAGHYQADFAVALQSVGHVLKRHHYDRPMCGISRFDLQSDLYQE